MHGRLGKFVLSGVGNTGIQVSCTKAPGTGCQQIQGLFNVPEHKAGEEAVGQQHRTDHSKQYKKTGQHSYGAQVLPDMFTWCSKEIEDGAMLAC